MLERFQLYYAPAVGAELREEFPSGREFWRLARDGVLIEAVAHSEQVRTFGNGERAAINLALEHRDWVLLIDDRRPFLEGERLGLKVLCTPVLVVDLHGDGRLSAPQALQALARLATMGTVSPVLLEAALAHLGAAGKGQRGQ